jgi:hypothetical protein
MLSASHHNEVKARRARASPPPANSVPIDWQLKEPHRCIAVTTAGRWCKNHRMSRWIQRCASHATSVDRRLAAVMEAAYQEGYALGRAHTELER